MADANDIMIKAVDSNDRREGSTVCGCNVYGSGHVKSDRFVGTPAPVTVSNNRLEERMDNPDYYYA